MWRNSMLPEWAGVLAAKAKVAAVMAAAVAAGGLGGSVALSQVGSPNGQVVESASTTTADQDAADTADPETAEAGDPESGQAQDPETGDAGDPDSGEAQDPETGEVDDPEQGGCPADAGNHGDYVSSVARSGPHGKGGVHGKAVSDAAHSDCGKAQQSGDPEAGEAGTGSAHHK